MGNTCLCVPALLTDIMFSVLLLFCIGYTAGQTCQQAGSKCYSVTTPPIGVVGGSCCDSCRPYLAAGTTSWDGTTDWYCQYATGGTEGATCSDYTGSCASGLSCVNGVCSSASTTVSSSVTTTASSSDTTTAAAATTTAENCNANAGDVCEDTTYGITKTCCSPYTCETLSGSTRSKTCQGLSLTLNQTCFEGGSSVGTCASGLVCLDGICQSSTTCALPVYPGSLCYSADASRTIAECCTGSWCVQPTDGNADSFCMNFSLAEGEQCGETQAREYRGYCNTGLHCNNGVCSSSTTTSTTTTTTTTTTVTTTTVTTAACIASGQPCWTGSGPPLSNCCGSNPSCNLATRNCP